jgi:hypothetical protein
MLADVGRVALVPHPLHDLQGLLEALEPLGRRRERQAEPPGLRLVPRGPDAEHRAPAGEHVERADELREHPGLAVAHGRDPGQQLHARRARGEVAQRRVRLQHLVFRRPEHPDLPDVVHHADAREAGVLGGGGDPGEVLGEPFRARGIGEVRNVQTDVHGVSSVWVQILWNRR